VRTNHSDMTTKLTITFLAVFLSQAMVAQKVTIKKLEQAPTELNIYYDLEDSERNRTYLVQLFSSVDNFSKPLEIVSGEVGIDIKPGINRKIVWGINKELGSTFIGDVQLEIRGKLYVPFIQVNNTEKNRVVKRALPTEFSWAGNTDNKMLTFNLFRNEQFVAQVASVPNTGQAEITLPPKTKPGDGYYLMISDATNHANAVKTETFHVKERIPLLLKFVPVAVVGTIIVILLPDKKPDTVGSPLEPPVQKN
jgi:hypothetical protein